MNASTSRMAQVPNINASTSKATHVGHINSSTSKMRKSPADQFEEVAVRDLMYKRTRA